MLHPSSTERDVELEGSSSKIAPSTSHGVTEGPKGTTGPNILVRKASSSLLSKRSKKVYETKHDPFRAAHVGDVDLLRRLLDRDGGINKTRWSGWTLLHRAAESGQTEVCEVLLKDYGADVNARSTRGWHTPLHLSLANGFLETSLLLVS
jgi:ankyrin repeat protein